jgi:hypothetical protein
MARAVELSFLKRLLPLYLVLFIGFFGYSLMITVFTPLFINGHGALVPSEISISSRSILLGLAYAFIHWGSFWDPRYWERFQTDSVGHCH